MFHRQNSRRAAVGVRRAATQLHQHQRMKTAGQSQVTANTMPLPNVTHRSKIQSIAGGMGS
jgi:hypothetical protein